MTLTSLENCTQIGITSTLLNNFITAPASYTKLEVLITWQCGTNIVKTYTSVAPIIGTGDVVTITGSEFINPSFFGTEEFADGVYSIVVKLYPLSGSPSTDSGCIFIDCNTKCTICTDDLTSIMYHYTITNTQDCGCDCQKLCDMFSLIKLTGDTSNSNPCGC